MPEGWPGLRSALHQRAHTTLTQALAAMARARTNELLYAFSKKLAGAGTLDDVLWASAYQTALMLDVRVVGMDQSVTFEPGDQTIGDVVARLNAQLTLVRVDEVAGQIRIRTDLGGTNAHLEVTGGDANAVLAFPTSTSLGSGNVGLAAEVTATEIAAIVMAAVPGVVADVVDGALRLRTVATGAGASLQVLAASSLDERLGFDNAVHTGSSGGVVNALRVEGKDPGSYGNRLELEVRAPTSGAPGTFDLAVIEDGAYREVFADLSMSRTNPRFVEAIAYLLIMGLGLGAYLKSVDGVSYVQFIAPGVAASSVMFGAILETSYNAFVRIHVRRVFEAAVTTPLSVGDVVVGEYLWGATRGTIYGVVFLAVMAVFGLVASWWALLCPLVFIIGAFTFAVLGMSYTSFAKNIEHFNIFWTGVLTPMFLFSGIFFPFANNYGIYMHDTATRWLFSEGSRNFSHGCIRLLNPLDFVEKVYGGRGTFDKKVVQRVIDTGQQAGYSFPEPVKLYVTYRTVSVDGSGAAIFRDDVYGRDKRVVRQMGKPRS